MRERESEREREREGERGERESWLLCVNRAKCWSAVCNCGILLVILTFSISHKDPIRQHIWKQILVKLTAKT